LPLWINFAGRRLLANSLSGGGGEASHLSPRQRYDPSHKLSEAAIHEISEGRSERDELIMVVWTILMIAHP